jgi:hypothetical protein
MFDVLSYCSMLRTTWKCQKGSPLGLPYRLQGVAYSLRRRLHPDPFSRNRKRARGDYVPIYIVVGVIA